MENEELILELEKEFISELRELGLELSDDAVCHIDSMCIKIGIKDEKYKIAFGSEVTLYFKDKRYGRENEMNYGVTGCFTPKEKESFWRTVHATEILWKWEEVIDKVELFGDMYKEYTKE